jgi:hypothetical protein
VLLDFLLSEEDRERFKAPDVLVLDTDKVRDQPAKMLIRWEAECGYSIERALNELVASNTPPAAAVLVCVWLARKQMGADGGGQDDEGRPEAYASLADLRTIRVGYRLHELEADALPPESSPVS